MKLRKTTRLANAIAWAAMMIAHSMIHTLNLVRKVVKFTGRLAGNR